MLLFRLSASTAQERILLEGKLTEEGEGIENVHVRNITSKQFSVSDQDGQFHISAAAGDTLLFTHVTMQDLINIVSKEEMSSGSLLVKMIPRDNELEEVILEDPGIDAVSVGIISAKKEIPTTYERRLQTAGDVKWYHMFGILGGSLSLDPILNAINGRTKKMKRNIQIERKIEDINYLNENYLQFMKQTFAATEAEIQRFWDHLVEQEEWTSAINAGNEERMKFYLTDQWLKNVGRLGEE